MRARRTAARVALTVTLLAGGMFVLGGNARALFHLMLVREIFAGTVSDPTAQFIELQMYAGNQNFVAGHSVTVFDASGNQVGSFTFTETVPNGENQDYILIATPAAEEMFGKTADLEMTPVITPDGGKVCWADTTDCASWGSFSPDDEDSGAPFSPATGILPGQSMERRISGGEDPDQLDEGDDTDNSAADFEAASPSPQSNTETESSGGHHGRTITLSLEGDLVARGRVGVEDDFAACRARVPVRVQRKSSGKFKTVARTTTKRSGRYRAEVADRPGTYRSLAPAVRKSDEHCGKATSRKRRNGN